MLMNIALAAMLWQTLGTTVVVCDAAWLDGEALKQMIGPEIRELPEAERADLVLIVDACSDTAVRLRVMGNGPPKSRQLQLADIPEEARIRTIALTLGELAREPAEQPYQLDQSEKCDQSNQTDRADCPDQPKMSAPSSVSEQALPVDQVDRADPTADVGEAKLFLMSAHIRSFALEKTPAPEARLGIRLDRWHLSFGGYAMGWRHSLGRAYLVSATFLAGPNLVERTYSKASIGLDVRLELGGVMAFGIANEGVEHTSRFNVAAGGHLLGWVRWGQKRRFRPSILLGAGWLRGLNIFAGDTHLGGFEGLSLTAGVEGAWCRSGG